MRHHAATAAAARGHGGLTMEVRVAGDADEAAVLAGRLVARRLRAAVARRGTASLAVSGGGTPDAMFDELARLDLPWPSITLFQVDERVAPDGDPDRNAVALVEHLVDAVRIPAPRVRLMPVTAAQLPRAAARYAAAVGAAAPIDVVHLGIGDDGHTASWPPGHPVIDSTAPVDLVEEFNGRPRMTLTPGPVNGARCRVLLVAGASKQEVLERYVRGDRDLPIGRVRRTNTFVFVDPAAAPRTTPR